MPAAERQFLAAAREGQSAAKDSNEVKLVGERKQRNQALCEALGDSKQVADWLGKVSDVRTTMGGDKGVLTIEMDDDIEVGTWNNAVSDIGSHTLVETSDPLYAQIADLEKGDKVRFSGEFVADKHDCVRETSLTDRGGMRTPSFVMKFSAVSPTR